MKYTNKTLRTSRTLRETFVSAVIAMAAAVAVNTAALAEGQSDSWWAGGSSGTWGDANWYYTIRHGNSTFTEGQTAYFTNSVTSLDLGGVNRRVYFFRSPYATLENPLSVTLVNGTLTFVDPISDHDGFTNMTVVAGAGANIVNSHDSSGFQLKSNTGLVLKDGATLTETYSNQSKSKFCVGYNAPSGTSNFVYIAAGSSLYTPRYIQIGASTSATSHPTGVVTVAGANASLDAQEIWLGYVDAKSAIGGYGGLFVTDGATAKSRSTFLMGTDYVENSANDGIYPGVSELVVSGEGSSLEVGSSEADKHFSVREYGTKKVLVENGGRLTVHGEIRNYAANDHIHSFDVTVRNGGVLEFKNIYFSNHDSTRMDMPGQGKCSFTVDGGTTRALASFTTATANGDENFHPVTVGPGGWTFDTQDFDVVWKRVINFGTGTFRKVGSGKFEFNWVPKFPGTIDVAEGTLILGGSETAKFPGTIIVRSGAAFKRSGALSENEADFVLEAGATVQPMQASGAVPTAIMAKSFTLPETGVVTVRLGDSGTETTPFGAHPVLTILGDGVFTQSDLAKFACLGGGSLDYRFHVSSDAKSILLSVSPAGSCTWTGLGDGTTFSDTANWSGGVKPVAGDAKGILFPAASGALTNDIAGLTPAWIAFGANTAGDISVSGNGFTGLLAVTNLSTAANATFTVPVAYAAGAKMELYQAGKFHDSGTAFDEKGYVIFEGGVTGDELISNTSGSCNVFAGHWTRTSATAYAHAKSQSGDYRQAIYPGSSLTVGSADYTKELYIGNGGAFTAGTITVALTDGQRFSVRNYGEYVVTNCLTITGNTTKDVYTGYLAGRDVFKFEKIKLDQTSGYTSYFGCNGGASKGTFFIGKGGIEFGSGNSRLGIGKDSAGDSQTIRPWYSDFTITHGTANTEGDIHAFRDVVFNTDDENGIGRTITLNAWMLFNKTPTCTISGSGRLLVTASQKNTVQPPVTVKDTATLAFGAAGIHLTTTGAVTFYGGTTLQLPAVGAGSVTLGGSLSIAGEGNVTLKLGEGTETIAPGKYSIFTVANTIGEDVLSRLVLANPTEGDVGYNFNANTSGTVYLYVGDTPHTTEGYCLWTGAAGDGKFSTAANWQGGRRPQDVGSTASIFFNSAGGEITNDVENLSVAEIYFGKTVPFVKLVGKPISGVSTVSNSGTVNHEIALALSCDSGTPTIPKTTSGYVLFSGGYTAPQFSTASGSFWGKVTMTSSDQWISANMNIVQSGAELTIPNTVSSWTQILEGGRMNAGTITRNGCERHNQWKSGKKTYNTWWALITDHLSGTVRVGEVKTEHDACAFQAYSRGANGIIIADKLTCVSTNAATGSNPWFNLNCGYYSNGTRNYSSGLWAIGPGGLTFGTSNHGNAGYMVEANTTLKSFADWSVDARNNGWAIYGYQNAILTIDTDHYFVGEPQYDEGATVHTVTINGSLQDTLGLKVTGGGKVVFNNDGSGFKNGVTVEDAATFAINAGKKPGTGAVTLTEGSCLEIPEADLGTATVGGALTFNAGTTLVVSNLTSGVTPLTVGSLSASQAALVVEGETPLADGDYTILSLASGSLAAGVPGNFSLGGSAVAGKNASLSVSGGNLVLTVDGEGAPNADFHVWTGEGGDGLFSTAANWVGSAPVAGDGKALMFNNASGALVNDIPGLTPATITFGAGIGQLSISGEGFSNVGSVVNNSASVTPVLNTPVAFSGNVTYTTAATMNSSYGITGPTIDFAGGASGAQVSLGTNKKYMKGAFYWTSDSTGFSAAAGGQDRMTVGTNSTVTATAADCGDTHELMIMPGGSLVVSNKTVSAAERTWCWNMGKFIVLGKYSFTGSGGQHLGYTGNATSYGFSGKNLGSLWANTISIDGTGVIWFGNDGASTTYKNTGYDIYVGEGGLQFGSSSKGTYATQYYSFAKFHPWGSDFTIMAKPNGDYSSYNGDYYTNGDTEFVTTDADGETPRTITMAGIFTQDGSNAGKLTISGNGMFLQTGAKSSGTKRTGALEVKDTATLKFGNAAAFIGTGPVTMAAGTTLAVPAVAPGVDSVALGSTFAVSGEGKVKLVVGDGLELAAGDYGICTLTGGIAAEDAVAAFDLQNATADDAELYVRAGVEVRLSVGGVKQVCTWTGAANDGNKFSTPGNWSPEFVPANGSDLVFPSASGTLVNDISGFAARSMTFGAGIGDVTVSGNAISGVLAITNLSTTANATFTAPVAYAAGKTIEVYHGARYDNNSVTISSTGMVIFEGGVSGEETMDNASGAHNIYAGHWTRMSSSAWSYASSRGGDYRHIIYDGSSLTVGSAGYTKELSISDGGAFTAATVTVALADGQRLSCQNRGEYVVTECLTVNGSTTKDIYTGWSYANAFKFEKVKLDQTSGYTPYFACQNSASQGTFFIGKGGIEFGTGNSRLGIGRNLDGDSQTIRPWYSDFTITHGTGNSAEEIHAFRDIVFCTDDESGVGRTITLNARPRFNYTPTLTVSGSGTLVVNSVHNNAVQPPVTVTDTATLKFGNIDAKVSDGVHTFHAGTTLAVPLVTAESGDLPVLLGTGIVLPAEGQVKLVIGDGSEIPAGHYRVLALTSGALPDGYAEKFALQNPTVGAAVLYSNDSRTLRLAVGVEPDTHGAKVWTGATGDGKLSTPGNWLGGSVPAANDDIFIDAPDATVVNDLDIAIKSITFKASSAPVTITGNAFTGVAAVTNLSTAVQTLSNEVSFASTYLVHCESATGFVDFAGGATATYPDAAITSDNLASHTLCGDITFTQNWTIPDQASGKPFVIPNGANVKGKTVAASSYQNANFHLRVEDGALATFETIAIGGKLVIHLKGGRLVATGDVTLGGADKRDFGYYGEDNNGTLEAHGIYKNVTGNGLVYHYIKNMKVGAGGFGMYRKDYSIQFQKDSKLTATADLAIHQPVSGDVPKDGDWGLQLNGKTFTIDTAGHTVTFDSAIHGTAGKIVKEGEGEMIMQSRAKNHNNTEVKGGTLTMKLTSAAGNGPISVASGATLKMFSASVTLPGTLTMAGGSTLAVPAGGAGSVGTTFTRSGSGRVNVTIGDGSALADGDYLVASVSGSIMCDPVESFALANNPEEENVHFYSPDGKTLRVAVGENGYNGPCVWTGEAGDGKFSTPGNWVAGKVPFNGASIVFNAAEMSGAVNDLGELQIDSITFAPGTAMMGVDGANFTGVKAVTNLSTTVTQTFFNHVAFGGAINVSQQATASDATVSGTTVRFEGGVSGTSMASNAVKMMYNGYYAIDSWDAPNDGNDKRQHVLANSVVSAGTIGNTHGLNILAGGAVTGAVVNVTPNANKRRLWAWNAGEFVITGEVVANGVVNDREMVSGWENNSVGKFEKITIDGNYAGKYFSLGNASKGATHQFWIGDGGLNFKTSSTLARYGIGFVSGDVVYLHPWHNGFEIGKKGDQGRFRFRGSGNSVLDTDNEAGEGKGIVFNVICESDSATYPVVIAGSGYVRYNAVNTHSGIVTVNSGATLQLGAGAKSGTGALTVKSGATLSAIEPAIEPGSAATIGAACTLEDGAILEFAISDASNSSFAFTTAPTGAATVKFAPGFNPKPGHEFTLATGVGVADECTFTLDPKYGGSLDVVDSNLVYTARNYFYIRVADSDSEELMVNPSWLIEKGMSMKEYEGDAEAAQAAMQAKMAEKASNGNTYMMNYILDYDPEDKTDTLFLSDGSETATGWRLGCSFKVNELLKVTEGKSLVLRTSLIGSSDAGKNYSEVSTTNITCVAGKAENISFDIPFEAVAGGLGFFV